MTHEEAIAFLEQYINSEVYTEKCISAHEMAITALRSAHAGDSIGYHFLIPHTTKMVPLTLEQLREMDGQPVWIVESPDWGHWELSEDAEDYICDRDTDLYGLTYPDPDGKAGLHKLGWVAYAYPPAHIGREAWEPCIKCNGKCYFCKFNETSKCGKCKNHEFYSPMFNFCPDCGRPLTEEAWAELEKRMGVR